MNWSDQKSDRRLRVLIGTGGMMLAVLYLGASQMLAWWIRIWL